MSTLPDESRLARPFASAEKSASSASQPPVVRAVACARSHWQDRDTSFGRIRIALAKLCEGFGRDGHAVPEVLAHAVWHEKLGVLGPAVAPLGETYLLFAERLAVECPGVVLVRRAIADMRSTSDMQATLPHDPNPL